MGEIEIDGVDGGEQTVYVTNVETITLEKLQCPAEGERITAFTGRINYSGQRLDRRPLRLSDFYLRARTDDFGSCLYYRNELVTVGWLIKDFLSKVNI